MSSFAVVSRIGLKRAGSDLLSLSPDENATGGGRDAKRARESESAVGGGDSDVISLDDNAGGTAAAAAPVRARPASSRGLTVTGAQSARSEASRHTGAPAACSIMRGPSRAQVQASAAARGRPVHMAAPLQFAGAAAQAGRAAAAASVASRGNSAAAIEADDGTEDADFADGVLEVSPSLPAAAAGQRPRPRVVSPDVLLVDYAAPTAASTAAAGGWPSRPRAAMAGGGSSAAAAAAAEPPVLVCDDDAYDGDQLVEVADDDDLPQPAAVPAADAAAHRGGGGGLVGAAARFRAGLGEAFGAALFGAGAVVFGGGAPAPARRGGTGGGTGGSAHALDLAVHPRYPQPQPQQQPPPPSRGRGGRGRRGGSLHGYYPRGRGGRRGGRLRSGAGGHYWPEGLGGGEEEEEDGGEEWDDVAGAYQWLEGGGAPLGVGQGFSHHGYYYHNAGGPAAAGAGGGGGGAEARLLAQLQSMGRDFGPEDYELLSRLGEARTDDAAVRNAVAVEAVISALPVIRMPAAAAGSRAAAVAAAAVVQLDEDGQQVVTLGEDDEEKAEGQPQQQKKAVRGECAAAAVMPLGTEVDGEEELIDLAGDDQPQAASAAAGGGKEAEGEGERDDECAICREVMQPGSRVKLLPCMHRFDADCVDQWLRIKLECPVCKHAVKA